MACNVTGNSSLFTENDTDHRSNHVCKDVKADTGSTNWKSLMMTAMIVVVICCVDKLLLQFAPGAWVISSVLADEASMFYVVILCAAYGLFALSGNRSASRSHKLVTSAQAPIRKVREKSLPAKAPAQPAWTDSNALSQPDATSPSARRDVINRAAPGTVARLNCMVSQAALRSGPGQAGELLERLIALGWSCDSTSFNIIIRCHSKRGELTHVEQWFERMRNRGFQPNEQTYMSMMGVSAKADDMEKAEVWMERMCRDGIAPTSVSYTMLIHAFSRLGNIVRAAHWLQRMEEAGLEPDAANYNSLIHACSTQCNAKHAEQWLQEMKQKGLEPTVMTYTALIDACAKSLDVPRAEKWMEDMLELGIEPNVVSYSTMISACAKVGNLERAEHWYNLMQDRGVQPNAYSYSALINACAQVGDVRAACSWLERAEKTGAALDGVVYGCVINACGKVGDAEEAMKVFRQMRAQGIRTHIVVYGALARPFAYQGDWEEVERIAEEMMGDGIAMNDYFLYTLLLAYSRAKPRQAERAEAAFIKYGIEANDRVAKALACAVGRTRCSQLLDGSMHSHRVTASGGMRCHPFVGNEKPHMRYGDNRFRAAGPSHLSAG